MFYTTQTSWSLFLLLFPVDDISFHLLYLPFAIEQTLVHNLPMDVNNNEGDLDDGGLYSLPSEWWILHLARGREDSNE